MAVDKAAEVTAKDAAREFFSSPYFAVAGASTNPQKFGHQIFTWYINHNLPVTPINPNSPDIEVHGKPYPTMPDIHALPHPSETSLSFLTQPAQTRKILEEAKALGIRRVWLQPGSFSLDDLTYAQEQFKAVGGEGNGSRAHDGWCVLVDGRKYMKEAGTHKL